jgi:hypothetical protein
MRIPIVPVANQLDEFALINIQGTIIPKTQSFEGQRIGPLTIDGAFLVIGNHELHDKGRKVPQAAAPPAARPRSRPSPASEPRPSSPTARGSYLTDSETRSPWQNSPTIIEWMPSRQPFRCSRPRSRNSLGKMPKNTNGRNFLRKNRLFSNRASELVHDFRLRIRIRAARF